MTAMTSKKDKSDALIVELYPRAYPLLLRYATLEAENRAVAEELVQEAFVVACEHPDKFLASDNPTGWLITTLRNLIRNYKRHKAQWAEIFAPDEIDNAAALSDTDISGIKTMYAGIVPDEDLDLIIAVELCGYTYSDEGDRLGISADACRKRLKRAEKIFEENYKNCLNFCPKSDSSIHSIKGGSNHVE